MCQLSISKDFETSLLTLLSVSLVLWRRKADNEHSNPLFYGPSPLIHNICLSNFQLLHFLKFFVRSRRDWEKKCWEGSRHPWTSCSSVHLLGLQTVHVFPGPTAIQWQWVSHSTPARSIYVIFHQLLFWVYLLNKLFIHPEGRSLKKGIFSNKICIWNSPSCKTSANWKKIKWMGGLPLVRRGARKGVCPVSEGGNPPAPVSPPPPPPPPRLSSLQTIRPTRCQRPWPPPPPPPPPQGAGNW